MISAPRPTVHRRGYTPESLTEMLVRRGFEAERVTVCKARSHFSPGGGDKHRSPRVPAKYRYTGCSENFSIIQEF